MDDGFEEQSLEPEVAEAAERRERCDYEPGDPVFWWDFAAKLRDAITPHAEPLWNTEYPDDSRAEEVQRNDRRWLCKAIVRATDDKAVRSDVESFIWLRRYINGEVPRDENKVRAVQDAVELLTHGETGRLGPHYQLPKLDDEANVEQKFANRQTDTKTDTPKKKRRMSVAAVDCCRIYREQMTEDDTITMKQVVSEYVEKNGGSFESIYRTVNDNPEQWRDG
jgi:hypothetical protein